MTSELHNPWRGWWRDSRILQSIHAWNSNTESEQTPQYCNPRLKQQHREWRLQNTAVNPPLKQPREWTDSTILQSMLETTTQQVKTPDYCSQSTPETPTQRGKRLHNTAVNPSLKQQHRGWGRNSTMLQSRQLSFSSIQSAINISHSTAISSQLKPFPLTGCVNVPLTKLKCPACCSQPSGVSEPSAADNLHQCKKQVLTFLSIQAGFCSSMALSSRPRFSKPLTKRDSSLLEALREMRRRSRDTSRANRL